MDSEAVSLVDQQNARSRRTRWDLACAGSAGLLALTALLVGRELKGMRERLESDRAAADRLAKMVATTSRENAEASQRIALLRSLLESKGGQEVPVRGGSRDTPSQGEEYRHALVLRRRAVEASGRLALAAFVHSVGLSDVQAEQLLDVWLRLPSGGDGGLADQAFREKVTQIDGAAAYDKLVESMRLGAATDIVTDLVGGLNGAEPLSSEQAATLAQIVAEASASYVNGGRTDLSDIDWSSVERNATSNLSPAQLEVLKGIVAQRQYLKAIGEAADSTSEPR